MNRRFGRLIATATISSGLLGVGFASLASAPADAAATVPSIISCSQNYVVKPVSFVTACGDGNAYFQNITWQKWAGAKAVTSKATFTMNNCTPTCVAGKFESFPATVTLSKPTTIAKHVIFTQLHATYVDGKKKKTYDFSLLTS